MSFLKFYPALIQAVFHLGDRFWARQNRRSKIFKKFVFQGKFCSFKAHAYYFTVLIYVATWRAAKLGIFTHSTSINLPLRSQSINSLMYVDYTDPQLLFNSAWSQSWSHFFVLPPPQKDFCITPCLGQRSSLRFLFSLIYYT